MALKPLRRTQRLSDGGLSCSVYQRCYTDSLVENTRRHSSAEPSAVAAVAEKHAAGTKRVTFYIGEKEETSSYEEECSFGLQKLLKGSLSGQVLELFRGHFGLADASVMGLDDMFPSVIAQLLHLSEDEPYGVRGASMAVVLERSLGVKKNSVMSTVSSTASSYDEPSSGSDLNYLRCLSTCLGTIKLCTATVTTFELTLTLREGKNLGISIRNWMANLVGSKQRVVIEPAFTLRKKKLYRNS